MIWAALFWVLHGIGASAGTASFPALLRGNATALLVSGGAVFVGVTLGQRIAIRSSGAIAS